MDYDWQNIGPLQNIPRQGARRLSFHHQDRPIAIFRTVEDVVFALIDECPHRRGPLSEGIICGNTVTCPLHNWVIGLNDGKACTPDEGQTMPLPVRIVDNNIHIGLPRAVVEKAA